MSFIAIQDWSQVVDSNLAVLSTPVLPFGNIFWWQKVIEAPNLYLDPNDNYQKMTWRNRYDLVSPQGRQTLSIPIQGGRNQRCAFNQVKIAYQDNWQQNHWRTICALYKRSPFFEHFEDTFAPLFLRKDYEYLQEWCMQGFLSCCAILNYTPNFIDTLSDSFTILDLSKYLQNKCIPLQASYKEYYQVFSDKTGFVDNASILDLIFCEGNYSKLYLK